MLELTDIKSLLDEYGDLVGRRVEPFDIGGRTFDFNARRGLMGVINLSADSWYRSSVRENPDEAIALGLALQAQGADFVDIGAESSLPHAARVGPQEQLDRLLPVVRSLCSQGVLISVESYYPEVLEATAEAGARIFNLTGNRDEDDALAIARKFDAAVIFCYVQGETVRHVDSFTFHENMVSAMESQFRERTERAQAMGVSRCIVDPGLGFYYSNLQDGSLRVNHQLHTLVNTFRLHALGFPTLNVLPHAPEIFGESAQSSAEPFFAVLALLTGSHILRTHELATVAKIRETLSAYRR